MESNKIDFLWKTINRFDGFYNSINNKATALSAFQFFLISIIGTQYLSLLPDFATFPKIHVLVAIIIILIALSSLISLFFSFSVIKPYTKSHYNPKDYFSNIFFGHICQHANPVDYIECVKKLDDSIIIEDLSKQAHILSQGLNRKYRYTRIATLIIIYIQLELILLLLIVKIILLNQN